MSASGLAITIPPGCDIRLSIVAPHSLVLVAPPGVEADLGMFCRPGVAGLFTFDPGLTWPDRSGCLAATYYLSHGCPILLQFESLADAMTCRKRLLVETAR